MEQREKTRNLLLKHYKTYPNLQLQDIFKFLYQSAFGCEHLVSSLETATDYILKEFDGVCYEPKNIIEDLDGNYSRVSLAYMKNGLSASTFGKIFVTSAKTEENGLEILIEKLDVVKELIFSNSLPFTQIEFEKELSTWQKNGFPAMHHSEIFRDNYHPSYRVIANKYLPFLPLFTTLDQLLSKGTVTLAIEGGSASGKTTLSGMLADIYDCTVFHMDDFFLRPEQRTPERYAEVGGNLDRERFLSEVLLPLKNGKNIRYRKFDCSTMSLGEEIEITPEQLTVVEGAYSMHPELQKHYDVSVYLNITPEMQRKRIVKRNTPQMANRFFYEWIPLEQRYFSEMNIAEHCDLKIDVLEA